MTSYFFMDKKTQKKLIIGIVVVLAVIVGYYFYLSGPQITSVGNSKISVTPDIISIYVNAEGRDLDIQKSQEKSLEIATNFLLELEKIEIDSSEVGLSGYNTYPEYNWTTGEIKGYVTSQQMIVKVSDFNKILLIVRAATNSKALVSWVNFELSSEKENEYKAQALKEASKDARVKANAIAEGVGKRIGRVVSVQTQDFYYTPYPYYARADMAVGNLEVESAMREISPKDLDVSASVSVTYSMTLF